MVSRSLCTNRLLVPIIPGILSCLVLEKVDYVIKALLRKKNYALLGKGVEPHIKSFGAKDNHFILFASMGRFRP